jgi:tetratricopeptide (TPR) repeat protein
VKNKTTPTVRAARIRQSPTPANPRPTRQGKPLPLRNNEGNTAFQRGDYAAALNHFQHDLAAAELTGDEPRQADLLTNIGSVWLVLGDFHKALHFFTMALALRERSGDKRGEIDTLVNLGNLYIELNDYEKALTLVM